MKYFSKDNIISFNIFIIFICVFSFSCSHFPRNDNKNIEYSNKFYIGTASTDNFQILIKDILLNNDYHIEYYDNGPISSYITTRWKIRDSYPGELDKGYLEAKTKIFIKGRIKSDSFELNNRFKYECYMEVKNLVYDGNDYIIYNEDENFQNEIIKIVEECRQNFSYNK